jgi:hypothetical protein
MPPWISLPPQFRSAIADEAGSSTSSKKLNSKIVFERVKRLTGTNINYTSEYLTRDGLNSFSKGGPYFGQSILPGSIKSLTITPPTSNVLSPFVALYSIGNAKVFPLRHIPASIN